MTAIRSRRHGLAIVVALAMLVRLLVPAGFMPQVAQGHVAIVACPGVMPAHGHGHDAPAHDGFERPCAFAGVAAAATMLAIVVLLAPGVAATTRPAPPLRAPPRFLHALRWRPPLRAPPLTPSIR